MNCCIDCFRDIHIRTIIEQFGVKGNCDFCSSKDVFIYNLEVHPNPVAELITGLVQAYSVSDNAEAKLLKTALRDDWDIFSAGIEVIQALTISLCEAENPSDTGIFTNRVVISKLMDKDFLHEFGVVRGQSWGEFSESIKHKNRFHSGKFNANAFATILSIVTKSVPADSRFFRARISSKCKGFLKNDMSAPPIDKRSAGRVNPEGVGVLYLSSDAITVLSEVRANAFDYVTIGEFQNSRDIMVVNLSGVSRISPFWYDGAFERFAVNRKILQEIAAEISKPLRRSDSALEYLPTQFISEFIKSQNYDGVEYPSTFNENGYNLAIFDETLFTCVDVKTVEVAKVSYRTIPNL
jgi:hypothetical protein